MGRHEADPATGRESLTQVFEFNSGFIQNQQGIGLAMTALPVLGLISVKSLPLPAGAIVIPLTELSRSEREAVMSAVKKGEALTAMIRTAQSGIVVAGAGTKLPPLPGMPGGLGS